MGREGVLSGRFNEILFPEKPIVWDDGPTYFVAPDPDRLTELRQEEAASIKRSLVAAHAIALSRRPTPTGYFKWPDEE